LSLAISAGWALRQIDVNNAFLHGTLSEDVFMSQPPGFSHPQFPQYICKLHKALYGLKQAPRAWFSRLSNKLLELGFHGAKSYTSLFTFQFAAFTMFIQIYVDDIIITCSKASAIDELLSLLASDFSIKDLGPLHFFLGIEVISTPGGSFLSQFVDILGILRRNNMTTAKLVSSPMSTTTSLSAFEGASFNDPTLYRSTIGLSNTYALHALISHSQSTNCLSSCRNPLFSIGNQSSASCDISSRLFTSGFKFRDPPLLPFRHSLMQTGQAAVTTGDQQVGIVFSWSKFDFLELSQTSHCCSTKHRS
jgi:hypothetical protein